MLGTIIFIRMSGSLPANRRVPELLQAMFPNCALEVIDLSKLINKKHKLINLLFVLKYYGLDLLFGHKKFSSCKYRTPYMFKTIGKLIKNQLDNKKYVFSFQIQSMFDASTGRCPHFVYTDHTHLENLNYSTFDKRKLCSSEWIRLETSIYDNASIVFTRSSNISRSLIQKYNISPERVVCVYAGSIAKIRNTEGHNDGYRNKNILFVGLNWERKGGPELIGAFEKVLERHPDATLTIVGSSPSITTPNCEVVGPVSTEEVNQYYERASVFCLPTKLEPFGLVFVEAMSHRLPIVATNVGAIPDMIENGVNGFLVEPGDTLSLSDKLIGLLGDPHQCQDFGSRSQQLAQARYSWEQVGDRMKKVILSFVQLPS